MTVTITVIARIPATGRADFQAYETAVLPLLGRHRGALERRLRTADGLTEVHVVTFAAAADLEAYRADPARAAQHHLLARSGAAVEVLRMFDVEPDL